MSYHCPSCHRVLYDRRLTHCGFCGADIPEGLRFTPKEITAQDREMKQLEQQSKQRQMVVDKKEKEEEDRRRKERLRMLITGR